MPVAFLTVKCVDNSLIHLDVDLKTLVEEFRSIIAPKCGIPKQRQKLVFAGRLLQDGRTLEAYGIERNSTIHLLTGGRGGAEENPDMRLPPQLGALQRHVLQNPDILQQMLESPAMQSLLNDFDFMRGVLKTDPRTFKLLDGLPELQQMLQDSEFMQQAAEAMRNPVHVRDVLRSTDRAATQLESLAGGSMDVLRLMCEDVRRPLRDQEGGLRSTLTGALSTQGDSSAHPGGEQDPEDIHEGNVRPPPEWLRKFDTNAMASMMQDQNMQQLMSQLVQSMPGPSGPLKKPHPDDPFLDPSFVGQMFQAQTLTSMTMLQQAVEQLSMTAAYDPDGAGSTASPGGAGKDAGAKGLRKSRPARYGAEESPAHDSPQVLSGLNPKSPAANFKESFSLFLQAEQDSPDVRFRSQLQAMANMGFTDKEVCIQALHAHEGNMNRAVESLVAGQVDK